MLSKILIGSSIAGQSFAIRQSQTDPLTEFKTSWTKFCKALKNHLKQPKEYKDARIAMETAYRAWKPSDKNENLFPNPAESCKNAKYGQSSRNILHQNSSKTENYTDTPETVTEVEPITSITEVEPITSITEVDPISTSKPAEGDRELGWSIHVGNGKPSWEWNVKMH
jgi:hypothetical protein